MLRASYVKVGFVSLNKYHMLVQESVPVVRWRNDVNDCGIFIAIHLKSIKSLKRKTLESITIASYIAKL